MTNVVWKDDLSSEQWDQMLASLKGHPLQTAKWGHSRRIADGIVDVRWAAFIDEKPIYLVRFEIRYIFKILKIAWVPRGPTVAVGCDETALQRIFLKKLKQKKFFLCIINPYRQIFSEKVKKNHQHTIWIDLTLGIEKLWSNLHTTFRRHVRNAKRKNIVVEQSKDAADLKAFYNICRTVSAEKGFKLHTSEKGFNDLVLSPESDSITSHLFLARLEKDICGGLFVIRCGENIYNWLAAVDRNFYKLSVGEVLHWEVAEWAAKNNYKNYDLEGIDKKNNRSVYEFKMKMNGQVVAFPGFDFYPLNFIASLAVICYSAKNFIRSLFNNLKIKKMTFSEEKV